MCSQASSVNTDNQTGSEATQTVATSSAIYSLRFFAMSSHCRINHTYRLQPSEQPVHDLSVVFYIKPLVIKHGNTAKHCQLASTLSSPNSRYATSRQHHPREGRSLVANMAALSSSGNRSCLQQTIWLNNADVPWRREVCRHTRKLGCRNQATALVVESHFLTEVCQDIEKIVKVRNLSLQMKSSWI